MAAIYTTYDELGKRVNNIDQYAPEGEVPIIWIADIITQAQDEIDGRLAHLYSVPFDPVPSLISAIARYLALSYLLNPGFVGEVPAESKVVDTNYRRADDLLKRLESGEVTLDVSSTSATPATPQSSSSSRGRVLTQTTVDADGAVLVSGSMEGV